jgi:hypothetical protein
MKQFIDRQHRHPYLYKIIILIFILIRRSL